MSFGVAISNAFDDRAKGAKVPDLYSFPTSALALEMEVDINTEGSGRFSFAVLPHPVLSVYTHGSGGTHIITGGIRTAGAFNVGTPKIFGCLTASQLGSTADSFRVVGCSWKMESLMTPLTCTGKVTLCQLPASEYIAPINANATVEDVPLITAFMSMPAASSDVTVVYQNPVGNLDAGVRNAGHYDSTMRNYATGHNVNAVDLQVNGIGSNLRILSPSAFDFKDSISDVVFDQTSTLTGGSVYMYGANSLVEGKINTTGQVTSTFGYPSYSTADQTQGAYNPTSTNYLRIGGWSNQYVSGQGFPTNSKVYTLRVAYHLEYIEAFISAGSTSKRGPIDTDSMSKMLNAHALLPFYRNVVTSNVNVVKARLAV